MFIKVGPSKKFVYLLQRKPLKNDEKYFPFQYFILKALFVLEIFTFLSSVFRYAEKRLISKFMLSQIGQ